MSSVVLFLSYCLCVTIFVIPDVSNVLTFFCIALEPTEAPSFITPLSNVMARAGQKIKLECEITGLPTPAISWNHNGKLLQETHDIRVS
jgi:hypothetical protein